MSSEGWQDLRGRVPDLLGTWQAALTGAILLGLIGGALADRKPSTAVLLCVVLGGVIALAMLGERAFPWAVVIVAVIPWYPFVAQNAEAPVVRQKVLCSAVAAAPLAPWLWSLATRGSRTRPSRGALLMGVLFAALAVLIYDTLGKFSALISSGIVGFVFIGVTFLCARRFGQGRGWLAAAFGGLLILGVLGAYAYLKAPSNRVGYFAGYPITYGALVVGLLPAALLFAYQRSRLLAGALATGSAALLIFSESRSSWVAATVMLIIAVILQARAGNYRGLAAVSAIIVVLAGLIVGTGSLHRIVEKKLSSNIGATQSVTHRQWSYGYAVETIGHQPVFGAGAPGFSSQEAANKTSIGAIDNGYLSITVDMGLIGLFGALIPIGVALRVLGRCLRLGVTPRQELALALGIIGMAVVTVFYDSFYWAQIDLLLGAMGGVLSVRLARIAEPGVSSRRRPARRGRGRSPIRWAT
ncbi:MAG: O-Antigen ligase [Solirubrobacterales bacterium]|jgi:O-antigen ligase|nr:O-Antigen ligase [Solirubrobacterales bacterium]